MRTLLAGELTQALSYDSDYYVKLEVQNGSGTWIDVSSYFDCLINASWGEHVNTPVSQATFTLVRNVGSESFAPFMEGSAINVDDLAAYSPLLELGRLVRAYTATMPQGTALDTAKYREIFSGRIDDIQQTDNPDGATPIAIVCSDLGAWLMDMQIETGTTRYGDTDGGTALETVLQAILDDNIPTGEPAVTLLKSSSSGFAVTAYDQEETKVLEGLTKLVLDSVGEDLRYRYDSSHVSQLTWFDPDRSRVTTDATITGYRLRKLNTSIDNIRNAGELPYVDATTGAAATVTSEDTASIAKYRRRFQRMAQSPLLTDSTSAQATIDAVVNDLSGAEADFEALCPYLWFVQLFDRYVFPQDGKTYDDDQTYGVVGYQHTIENGRGETVIQCAGRIVGAYAEWLKRIPDNTTLPRLDVEVPPLLSYTVRVDDSGADSTAYLTAKVQGGAGTHLTRAVASIIREPTEEEIDAATPSTAGQRSGVFEDIAELEAGKRFYVAGKAYDEDGNGSAVARISEVWLGIDSTPGADVTIGTILSQTDKIIYPVAFDNECAYCEIWTREFTTNPGSTYSVENLTAAPFRVLTLGDDAMVPGVEFDVEVPIAGPDNWLLATFVPFDHLGKRGNVKLRRTKGSRGDVTDPGGPESEASLIAWFDPGQESYADNDDVSSATDFSGNANAATCSQGVLFQPIWKENVTPAGTPSFRFTAGANANGITGVDLNTDAGAGEPEYLRTGFLGEIPTAGMVIMGVFRRWGAHVEHGGFYGGASNTGGSQWLKETHNIPDSTSVAWYPSGDVISGSLSTDFFIHTVVFESATVAKQYYNGVLAGSSWNPSADFDGDFGIIMGGGGEIEIAELQVYNSAGIDLTARHLYLSDKHFNGTVDPPPGTAPDPPAAAAQISNTVDTITVRVTMPASAPDSIRIGVAGTRSYDETVTVAGSATQDFVITGLEADTSYPLTFASVEAGLVSTSISIVGATDTAGGTLDFPTSVEQAYSAGSQDILVRAQFGANNPLGTAIHASTSTAALGPYTGDYVGYEDGFGALIRIPYAQTSTSHTVYIRLFARKADWTDSSNVDTSVVVPAR
jgi:hypothetical protein